MRWLLLFAAGCVDEFDPEVAIVLPRVPLVCAVLDARVDLDVETRDGERFTVSQTRCEDRLFDKDVAGYQLQLGRLSDGYHRLVARLVARDGTELGNIGRPFHPSEPLAIPFSRADIPSWPSATIDLAIECEGALELVGTAPDRARAVVSTTIDCAERTVAVPRGALVLAGTHDGACASAELFAVDGAVATFTRPCP